MKNRWIYVPVILSFLLLVAHFSRNDQYLFMIISVLIPFLLWIKKTWAKTLVQAALVLGAFSWVWSTLDYIEIRKAMGEDYQRLAIILFSVAGFTLISAILIYFLRSNTHKN